MEKVIRVILSFPSTRCRIDLYSILILKMCKILVSTIFYTYDE